MLHPNDAIPRRRLCRAFMKKFQIQRNSYGKSLISSFIRVLVGPRQTAANNRESNRKPTGRASCRLRWQPLLVRGATEIPTWVGQGGRSRVLAKRNQIYPHVLARRNQNLSRLRWCRRALERSLERALERALERCWTCAIVASPTFFDDGETDGLRFGPVHCRLPLEPHARPWSQGPRGGARQSRAPAVERRFRAGILRRRRATRAQAAL